MRIMVDILILCSIFVAFAGVVGMLRMPDVFCRMQSSTNIATLGVLGVILGGFLFSLVYLHDVAMALKLLMMGVFYIITNPITGHAICRGAYKHGIRPDNEMECDKYGEDLEVEE